ncbi:unnamed protein product [Ranitomeya imitator]|uniref:FAT domain-containing protein n=1 Tax=Ranitomeya imitator TaxID=111125 RepID=A0ABN9LUA8_9NEOB|nr:unnamed protein product [Ranitomeya imitator]
MILHLDAHALVIIARHVFLIIFSQILHYHGVVKSMLGLGQLSTVITQVNGILNSRPEWTAELNTYRVEAAWKLSKWDLVDEYLSTDRKSTNWSIRLGQLLLLSKKKEREAFYETLKVVRAEQIVPLSAASFERGSYQRGYEYIVRLHMLCELEHSIKMLLQDSAGDSGTDSLNWPARLEMTQNSYRAREPILALRRALLTAGKRPSFTDMIGECWLQSARVARKAGHHQTAYNALLNAGETRLAELNVERAKWLWSKGDVHQALIVLQKGEELFQAGNSESPEQQQIHGRAMLLVGRFMDETANFESNAVMKKYKIFDFTQLTSRPYISPNVLRICITPSKASPEFSKKSNMPSAYRAIFSSIMPYRNPLTKVELLIFCARGSTANAKSSGDSGHPCLVPLYRPKLPDNSPLTLTLAVGEEYNKATFTLASCDAASPTQRTTDRKRTQKRTIFDACIERMRRKTQCFLCVFVAFFQKTQRFTTHALSNNDVIFQHNLVSRH